MKEGEIRGLVVRHLEERGYEVTSIGKGSGVPSFSRLRLIAKDGAVSTCAVKTSTGGRISFTRDEHGNYPVLSEMNYVAHAQPLDEGRVRVMMFESSEVIAAFERNFESLRTHSSTHLPMWISPELEQGWRFVGSGFRDKALWTMIVSSDERSAELDEEVQQPTSQDDDVGELLARAKGLLASSLGLSTERVEIAITIRA